MGLLYIRECGDPYATDPPPFGWLGATPYHF